MNKLALGLALTGPMIFLTLVIAVGFHGDERVSSPDPLSMLRADSFRWGDTIYFIVPSGPCALRDEWQIKAHPIPPDTDADQVDITFWLSLPGSQETCAGQSDFDPLNHPTQFSQPEWLERHSIGIVNVWYQNGMGVILEFDATVRQDIYPTYTGRSTWLVGNLEPVAQLDDWEE